MGRTFLVLVSLLLLAGIGYAVYSVRTDALRARELQLARQTSKNVALSEEITRLDTFLNSPLCREITAQSQTAKP